MLCFFIEEKGSAHTQSAMLDISTVVFRETAVLFLLLIEEGCEGFQRAIAKPFDRARRREIPAKEKTRFGAL